MWTNYHHMILSPRWGVQLEAFPVWQGPVGGDEKVPTMNKTSRWRDRQLTVALRGASKSIIYSAANPVRTPIPGNPHQRERHGRLLINEESPPVPVLCMSGWASLSCTLGIVLLMMLFSRRATTEEGKMSKSPGCLLLVLNLRTKMGWSAASADNFGPVHWDLYPQLASRCLDEFIKGWQCFKRPFVASIVKNVYPISLTVRIQ